MLEIILVIVEVAVKVVEEKMEAVEGEDAVVAEEFRGQQGCIIIRTIVTRTDMISDNHTSTT